MRLFAAAVVAVALAGATMADAGQVPAFDTTVTIHYRPIQKAFSQEFRGKVKSERAFCRKDRKVKVFHVDAGPDTLTNTAVSAADGSWHSGNDIAQGRFYAKVGRVLRGPGVCKSAKSRTIQVSQT
jgi:hypothetical protein